MSRRADAVWVTLGFLALAVAATYPLIRNLGSHLPGDLGDPLLTTWTLAWDADRLRHGLRGVWDAPNFFPYRHTLLYSDHLLGLALFTAPVQWATGNPLLAYNVAFIASFAFAGVSMYVLGRELTGRRDAALAAGFIFAFQPFRVSHLSHLQWLVTGWLPLSLWALHRYFRTFESRRADVPGHRRRRYLIASSAFVLLQSLTATYFTYFALLPLGIVALFELRRTSIPLARFARDAVPALILAAIVLAPVVRAYYDARVELNLRRSVADITSQSADLADYFSAAPRLRLWGGLGEGRGEHELFMGAAAMILAAFGLLARRRSPHVVTYGVLLLAGLVLSLGPAPAAWGHRPGFPGPYALLLRIVPGLDGIRAPARLAVVVQLAVAVLAAFGASSLFDRLRARTKRIALASLLIIAAAEGWAAPIATPFFDRRGNGGEREAYAYLSTLPAGGVMELPTSVEDVDREFRYQFMTLVYRHRVLNGHSGYITPLVAWLGGGHSPLREVDRQRDALGALRAIDVRYVVFHRAAYDDRPLADALSDAIEHDRDQVIASRSFGDTTVAVLAPLDLPAAPAGTPALTIANTQVTASHSADRLPLLFDNDPDTRWISGGNQAGNEWIEIALDRQRDIGLVRLQLAERSFGDYPRDLAIDVVEDSDTRTVFRGSVLPQFARGLLANRDYPSIDLVLTPNRARVVRLRQLGSARRFFWSIHELRLFERL